MRNSDEARAVSSPSVPAEANPIDPTAEYPGTIDRIKVDSDGCVFLFRFGRGALQYYWVRLSLGHADYSALYSLLLACWLNERPMIASVRKPLSPVIHDPPPGWQNRILDEVEVGARAQSLWAGILRA